MMALGLAFAQAGERSTFDFGWKFKYFGPLAPGEKLSAATCDGYQAGHAAQDAIDGKAGTRWCAPNGGSGHWLAVKKGPKEKVETIRIVWENGNRKEAIVEYVANGLPVQEKITVDKQETEINVGGRTISDFKITVNGTGPGNWASISELTFCDKGGHALQIPVPETKAGEAPEKLSYDDRDFKAVQLPHDWAIESPFLKDEPNETGKLPWNGYGWYRKFFNVPADFNPESQRYYLDFDGVMACPQVYVNGKKAGEWAYGYASFRVDITPFLKPGKPNLIAVQASNKPSSTRWYPGAGIYRHVWLEKFDANKMDDPQKLFVRTENIYGMSADGTHADSASIRITYADKLDETRILKNVDLWSPDQPKLYDIKVGELTVKHGVRSFSYDSKHGFLLNGQSVIINGACVHHDDGVIGAMAFDAAEIRKVRQMKDAGFNLIRTSHNPQTRAMLDACDSIGMLVVDEAFDGWYTEKNKYDYHLAIDSCYREDLTAMVLRDRNHPSVISWSLGNEVIERKEIRVVQTASKFKAVITALDNTRPVTEALCAWDRDWEIYDPHAAVLDIVGYNYMMFKAESDHERVPERVMWQTESYPRDAFKNWKHTVERPYIIGDMVWTGLDYLGESSIGQFHYEGEPREESWMAKHFPYHGAYCGDVDLTGWRKPISHYRDLLWNAKEGDAKLYLAVREPDYYYKGHVSETMWSVWPTWESWNWKGWEGKDIEADIFIDFLCKNVYNYTITRRVSKFRFTYII